MIQSNEYKCVIEKDIIIHIGNGAKNELKKEKKKYNFKFFYNVNELKKIKTCSAGFDDINSFIKFIKPINNKYYIFEYIYQDAKCNPYFDYEYELDEIITETQIKKVLKNIINEVNKGFLKIFNITLHKHNIKIISSHGMTSEKKFKVSFHITIINYHFNNNYECEYIANHLHNIDINFDMSVYSTDRLMRTVYSFKNWNEERQFLPINDGHELIELKNNDNILSILKEYLITNVRDESKLLEIPLNIKKETERIKYKKISNINFNSINRVEQTDIGRRIENIIRHKYHEDVYYNGMNKLDNDELYYSFNYSDRSKKCFTGNIHSRIGFYCHIDNMGNIALKCFSKKCDKSKFIIANINETLFSTSTININNKYITDNQDVIKMINDKKLKIDIIRSSMGTGKTELITEKYIKINNPKRILWLSVRQSYANSIESRLLKSGLTFVNYQKEKKTFHNKDRIIVQIESLKYLLNEPLKPFDLIVMDEIESILSHFSSDTMNEKSEDIFNLLKILLSNNITKVIALDADVGERTINYFRGINKKIKVINNKYTKDIIKINLTNNLDYFIDDIKQRLIKNEKICIIGLSTKILYSISGMLDEMKIKYIMHTRDSDDKIKKDITDVNELWKNYQCVLYSPTITVGIDHTITYFDAVYSIIIPNTAPPRVYIQMLGRIRNLKDNNILTYYEGANASINKYLYNYEEIKKYFKYVDTLIKTTSEYEYDENGNLNMTNDYNLYNIIMMHNRIEDLNKTSEYFMTHLNTLCNQNNYKLVFIHKDNIRANVQKEIKKELKDDKYKEKIINAKIITRDEYLIISEKINNSEALESEKFSFLLYKFKKFWLIDEKIDINIFNKYFRNEVNMNRLFTLLGKKTVSEYCDKDITLKNNVIREIINKLGFDMNFLIKIDKETYYDNVKKLLTNSDFSRNYDKVGILFGKSKSKLNINMNGHSLAVFLNNFLGEFGLYIKQNKTTKKIDKKTVNICNFQLKILDKYDDILNKYIIKEKRGLPINIFKNKN